MAKIKIYFSCVILSMQGQRALGLYQKYINLCSEDERRSYGLEGHEGE